MSQIIPITNDARQTFTTVLNGQRVRFNFYYIAQNAESGVNAGWYSDFYLSGLTETSIIEGVRLTTLTSIVQGVVSEFSGDIYVIPLTSPAIDLTNRNPWGATHQLVYFEPGEINDATL